MPLKDTPFEIPYGYCQCGCGHKTPIAERTHSNRGVVKGQPRKFLPNHNFRAHPIPATWDEDRGCFRVLLNSQTHPGLYALVDECDREMVERYTWHPIVSKKPKHTNIYAERRLPRGGESRGLMMHVEIMQPRDGQQVDHINGDGLDNRRSNLRIATQSQNNANRRISHRNSSGFKGVSWAKRERRWCASIKIGGKSRGIGYFRDREEAARAYDARALELFGEFALTNEALGLFDREAE